MKTARATLTLAMGLIAVSYLGGCVTIPLNDVNDLESASDVDIRGYLDSGSDEVCVYVSAAETGTYSLLSTDSTPSTKTATVYGTDLFAWAADATIDEEDWSCLGTSGTAEAFLKVQERASGSCANSFDGSESNQVTLDYTWDDGTILFSCYTDNASWFDFITDCPLSGDAPVIRLEAEATYGYGDCHGDCATSGVSSVCGLQYFLQTDPDIEAGGHICSSSPIADADTRYRCFKDCSASLGHMDGQGVCLNGGSDVGQNPGDLCDSSELICDPVNFPREL